MTEQLGKHRRPVESDSSVQEQALAEAQTDFIFRMLGIENPEIETVKSPKHAKTNFHDFG